MNTGIASDQVSHLIYIQVSCVCSFPLSIYVWSQLHSIHNTVMYIHKCLLFFIKDSLVLFAFVSQFTVLRDGCWQKINFERNQTLLKTASNSHDFSKSPWTCHFRCAGRSANLQEYSALPKGEMHSKRTFSQGLAASLDHQFHQDSDGSVAGDYALNFVCVREILPLVQCFEFAASNLSVWKFLALYTLPLLCMHTCEREGDVN